MKRSDFTDYNFYVRKSIKHNKIEPEYLELAKNLKQIVDKYGAVVFSDVEQFFSVIKKQELVTFKYEHIQLIITIIPQIRLLYNEDRFFDEETITEQMYFVLLKNGLSRNVILGLLYAVFFSLSKTLKLSKIEKKQLEGSDTFIYQQERDITVNDSNIESVEQLVKLSDNNATVELGNQILNGNIKKYKYRFKFAIGLCEEGLNHGSGKAAQVLGNEKLLRAGQRLISNNDYSKAFEYYTAYGSKAEKKYLDKSHSGIVNILNLGIYNKKMMLNYTIAALIFITSFFVPMILNSVGITTTLNLPTGVCVVMSSLELLVVIFALIIRYIHPFFTQGWIVFLQSVIWFVGIIMMIY